MSQVRIGSWLTRADLGLTEVFARHPRFDWLSIDMEHNAITVAQAENQIRIIQAHQKEAFVRLPSHDPSLIATLLDAGANGIIAPRVNSRDEAARIVNACFYPPKGTRGVGLARAQQYRPEGLAPYRDGAHQAIKVIVQIEHRDALAHLPDIFSLDGVHGFFIGPYDLSASFGKPGDFTCPEMREAVSAIIRAGKAAGLAAGIHVVEPDKALLAQRIEQGFDFIAFSFDMLLLIRAIERELP